MKRLAEKIVLGAFCAAALAAVPARAADIAVLQNGFSIRHEHREEKGATTRLFLTAGNSGYVDIPTLQIDHFEKDLTPSPAPVPAAASTSASPSNSPSNPAMATAPVRPNLTPMKLDDVVSAASSRHQLDPDLVNSVIRAESGFNRRAVSPKGAQGLMQLMPKTASKLGVKNAFDPQDNVEGGAQYLRTLLEQYNFDLVKALAAYNAGPQRVAQYRGVPPYLETQAYVARIVRDFNRKKLAEQKLALAAKAQHRKAAAVSRVTDASILPESASRQDPKRSASLTP